MAAGPGADALTRYRGGGRRREAGGGRDGAATCGPAGAGSVWCPAGWVAGRGALLLRGGVRGGPLLPARSGGAAGPVLARVEAPARSRGCVVTLPAGPTRRPGEGVGVLRPAEGVGRDGTGREGTDASCR